MSVPSSAHPVTKNIKSKNIRKDNPVKKDTNETNSAEQIPCAEDLLKEIESLKARIAELETEIKEKDDKHLRMAAEYDNYRRRSREEKDATYDMAVSDTVSELLPIIDNLERAAAFEEGEKVKEGLAMIAGTVSTVFAKLKIEPIGQIGDTFDANYHNAVLHAEDDTRGEGEIVEVFQKGYKKGNRIIRFAMVKSVN
jgi:molecular chaperone GrpE